MKDRPLFIPLASIIAGILLAGLFSCFLPKNYLLPLLLFSLLSLFLPGRLPFFLAISLLFLWWGNLSLQLLLQPTLSDNHISKFASNEPVTMEGVIDSRVEATNKQGSKLYLQMERIYQGHSYAAVTGRLLLHVGQGQPATLTGDRVRFISGLYKPRNYGLPGEFDFVRHLSLKNIYATAFVKEADDVILVRAGVIRGIQRYIDELAGNVGDQIGRVLPTVEGGILRALLIGERGYVPRTLETAYAQTGVNHILSISGFHVAIIALFVFHVMLGVGRNFQFLTLSLNLRKTLLIFTLPLIIFYLFLSGAAPATTRSVVMIAAYVFALVLDREVEPVNSLLLAAIVILGLTPGALFDVSFQLSFIALWGIIVLTPLLMSPFAGIRNQISLKLLQFTMASLAAIVATMFPVAFYFHSISFTGIISNLVVVPLVGYGAVVLGFSSLPFILTAPFLAKPLLFVAAFLVKVANTFVLFVSQVPTLSMFNPDRLDLLLFYLSLVVLTFVTELKKQLLFNGAIIIIFICNILSITESNKGQLKISFFSVGQGESTLVAFPDGKKMLIDGGGSAREDGINVGERLLAPALLSMGIISIDYLVLTHGHPDHIQGLLHIADNFTIGEFLETGIAENSANYRRLKTILDRRRIPVRVVNASHPDLMLPGGKIEWLWPGYSMENGKTWDLNDDSLVFRLSYGNGAVLFTGDIGAEVEKSLVKVPHKLQCNVLKVAHHGSRYSTSQGFLDTVSPEIALISAGYGNSFHLPAEQTLKKLKVKGTKVCRTDLEGTIHLIYDEKLGKFELESQRRAF